MNAREQVVSNLDRIASILRDAANEAQNYADRARAGDVGDPGYGGYHFLVSQAYRAYANAGPNLPFADAFRNAGDADRPKA